MNVVMSRCDNIIHAQLHSWLATHHYIHLVAVHRWDDGHT